MKGHQLDLFSSPDAWIGLVTLTVLEIVLGIDNIVFLSILAAKLPAEQRNRARKLGLLLAMGMRIALLFTLSAVMRLSEPIFTIPLLPIAIGEISGRDLILLVGGMFLIAKSVREIHEKLEGDPGHVSARVPPSFNAVLLQIMVLDLVFSLDSVITAVGMVDQIPVMVTAVVLSVMVMLVFSGPISEFVDRHPTVKILALAFLVLIGVNLIAEGMGQHLPKGYTYFAMAFAFLVEMLNLRVRSKAAPVELHEPITDDDDALEREN